MEIILNVSILSVFFFIFGLYVRHKMKKMIKILEELTTRIRNGLILVSKNPNMIKEKPDYWKMLLPLDYDKLYKDIKFNEDNIFQKIIRKIKVWKIKRRFKKERTK